MLWEVSPGLSSGTFQGALQEVAFLCYNLVSDVYPLLSVGLTMKVLNDVLYARVDQGRDGLEVPAGGNRLDLSQTCRVVSHHSGSSAIMRRIFRGSAAGFFVSL